MKRFTRANNERIIVINDIAKKNDFTTMNNIVAENKIAAKNDINTKKNTAVKNNIAEKITDSELEIMRVLWAVDEPLTLTQIKEPLMKMTKWNGDTIKTLLTRLCKKGAVSRKKQDLFYYSPMISSDDYGKYSTQTLIDKLYSGSARNMISALVKNDQLSVEDIEELREMFKGGADNE